MNHEKEKKKKPLLALLSIILYPLLLSIYVIVFLSLPRVSERASGYWIPFIRLFVDSFIIDPTSLHYQHCSRRLASWFARAQDSAPFRAQRYTSSQPGAKANEPLRKPSEMPKIIIWLERKNYEASVCTENDSFLCCQSFIIIIIWLEMFNGSR